MRTYGIAILGAGNVARGHLQAIRSNPRAELSPWVRARWRAAAPGRLRKV